MRRYTEHSLRSGSCDTWKRADSENLPIRRGLKLVPFQDSGSFHAIDISQGVERDHTRNTLILSDMT